MLATRNFAFTLLELAVVLVIIALMSGGIVVGREMIKGAEMRGMFRQIEQYETARLNFTSKYNCLPGDCTTAVSYNLGQNGNGNGILDVYVYNNSKEFFQYWSQLAAAQLITGSYTGEPGPGGIGDYVIGVNSPITKRVDVGVGVFQFYPSNSEWKNRLGVKERADTHFYTIGRDFPANAWGLWYGAFTIAEMLSMDRKFDDGYANSGRIRTHAGSDGANTTGCTLPINADADTTADFYYGTSTTAVCSLWYLFWP